RRAWRKAEEKTDRKAKERADARRRECERSAVVVDEDIPDGISRDKWRTRNEERDIRDNGRRKADAASWEPEALAAVEAEARRLARAMEPSRRRPAKLKR